MEWLVVKKKCKWATYNSPKMADNDGIENTIVNVGDSMSGI